MAAPATAEFVEKRSRFIGEIRPIRREEAFAAFLAEKRAAHYDARHNCWAYILRSGAERYSDDGEPQGTAGVPMLEVLRREGIQNIMVVVTRYFGGTLLGAGGLVRAYSHTAKLTLDAATRVEVCRCAVFSVTPPYPLYDRVTLLLEEVGAVILDTDFGAGVTLRVQLRANDLAGFAARLTELSSGTLAPQDTAETFAPMT